MSMFKQFGDMAKLVKAAPGLIDQAATLTAQSETYRARMDAQLAEAVERDRPDVALAETVHADELVRREPQLVDGIRQLHVQERGGLVQALEMVGEPEDRGAGVGLVAADPLEHTGPVVEAVGTDVNLGVGPVDELPVHPDLLGRFHGSKVTRR